MKSSAKAISSKMVKSVTVAIRSTLKQEPTEKVSVLGIVLHILTL